MTFNKNKTDKALLLPALWAGFVGGNLSSFVKWGTEVPLPPRTPDRASPPAEMLRDLGVDVDHLTYVYSGHIVPGGVLMVHHLFSIFFALLYCVLWLRFPRIAMGQGVVFGLVVTLVFHGTVLPAGHWAPALWNLPRAEIFSETIGHMLWAWVIELMRRELMPSAFADVRRDTKREPVAPVSDKQAA
ncbi:DUF1440 domain-containing protein [Asaia sp. W19]|uniref:YagU family protein n=1 Tax=unclassified Asaia TaxID=2685023 RepID=UPI000F8E947B|nr:DUF1440 domain-containing protein [Asaia sp. W19]RUT26693.1 DUF1440 domain-containing protein [Asaia sp. W19]